MPACALNDGSSAAGDSDDGIVTRSIMYLFEQLAKRPANAAPINIKCASGDLTVTKGLNHLLRCGLGAIVW